MIVRIQTSSLFCFAPVCVGLSCQAYGSGVSSHGISKYALLTTLDISPYAEGRSIADMLEDMRSIPEISVKNRSHGKTTDLDLCRPLVFLDLLKTAVELKTCSKLAEKGKSTFATLQTKVKQELNLELDLPVSTLSSWIRFSFFPDGSPLRRVLTSKRAPHRKVRALLRPPTRIRPRTAVLGSGAAARFDVKSKLN